MLVRKKVGDNLSLTAGYYEDMISSASIDVKLSASPYHETRKQENGGFDYLHGKTTYSAGYIHSREPDYIADTTYFSVSQDMFGDLTTLTLGYRRGWDQIFRDIKDPDGVIINDPTFHQRADHRGYSLSLSQILTRNSILNFNYELLTDQGYLANPYREIRYLDPTSGAGVHARPPGLSEHAHQQRRLAAVEVLPAVARLAHRAVPLLPRHLGHRRQHHRARLHLAGVAALDLRRQPALLRADARQLLQRPVSARRLPELHGA